MYRQAAEERLRKIDADTKKAKELFEHANEERTQLAHSMLKKMPEFR